MIKPRAILKTPVFQPQLGSDLNPERPSSNSKRERGSRTPEVQKTTCAKAAPPRHTSSPVREHRLEQPLADSQLRSNNGDFHDNLSGLSSMLSLLSRVLAADKFAGSVSA
jgi:hypothetical protein